MPMGPYHAGKERAPKGVHVTVLKPKSAKDKPEELWRYADGLGRWHKRGYRTRDDAVKAHANGASIMSENRLAAGSVAQWRSYIE